MRKIPVLVIVASLLIAALAAIGMNVPAQVELVTDCIDSDDSDSTSEEDGCILEDPPIPTVCVDPGAQPPGSNLNDCPTQGDILDNTPDVDDCVQIGEIGELEIDESCLDDLLALLAGQTPPQLEELRLRSDNDKSGKDKVDVVEDMQWATTGNDIRVEMDFSDDVENVKVLYKIGEESTEQGDAENEGNNEWVFTYTVQDGDAGGFIIEQLSFEDDTEDPETVIVESGDIETDGSEVTVDTDEPAIAITFVPDQTAGVIEAEENVEVAYQIDEDNLDFGASRVLWELNENNGGIDPLDNDEDAGSFSVPVGNGGELIISYELEDMAKNRIVDSVTVTVLPPSSFAVSLLEGDDDADGQERWFGENQERTYRITLSQEEGADPVDRVTIDFDYTGQGMEFVSVDGAEPFVNIDESDFVERIIVQADGGGLLTTFDLTVRSFLQTDSRADISVRAWVGTTILAAEAETTAIGDRRGPEIMSHELAPTDEDGIVSREEYFNADKVIELEVTVKDDHSGMQLVQAWLDNADDEPVRLAEEQPDIPAGDGEKATLELELERLLPGVNQIRIRAIDNVGNIAEDEFPIEIEVRQFIVVDPGVVYLQSGGNGQASANVDFDLEQWNLVDDTVEWYELRAAKTMSSEWFIEDYDDPLNNHALHRDSNGAVRFIFYPGPNSELGPNAEVAVFSNAEEGENFFHLHPKFDESEHEFDESEHDVQVVDTDFNPFDGAVFRVVVDNTPPELNGVWSNESEQGEKAILDTDGLEHGITLLFDVYEENPFEVTVAGPEELMVSGPGEGGQVIGSFDGGSTDPVSIDLDLTAIEEGGPGTYSYTVSVEDAAGNQAEDELMFELVVRDLPGIAVDVRSQIADPEVGILTYSDFQGGPLEWAIEIDGESIPTTDEGCPCTYELEVHQDGTQKISKNGGISPSGVSHSIPLTGEADGEYEVFVRLLDSDGTVIAEAEDLVTIEVQPKITGLDITHGGGQPIGSGPVAAESGKTEGIDLEFTIDSDRAGLVEAVVLSELGYSTSTGPTSSGSDGTIIAELDLTSALEHSFDLVLDGTGDAPHGGQEQFDIWVEGESGLTPIMDSDVMADFTYVFDKDVDLLQIDAHQTEPGTRKFSVGYNAEDLHSGLEKVELFLDGESKESIPLEGSSEASGSFPDQDVPKDGVYEIKVVATDEIGNTREATATVTINVDAEVSVKLLQNGLDRMGGTLSLRPGDWEPLVLEVTNSEGEPTVAEVILKLEPGEASAIKAENTGQAIDAGWHEWTQGTEVTEFRFSIEVQAGETVEHHFSVRGVDGEAVGTWTVSAITQDGFTVSPVNGGDNEILIRTPETVTPSLEVTAEQEEQPLDEADGVLYATADQPEFGHADDSDEVTFTVSVTGSGEPLGGIEVQLEETQQSGSTNTDGIVVFIVDPDDHPDQDLNFNVNTLTFRVVEQEATTDDGVLVHLASEEKHLQIVWTGFHVHLDGPSLADSDADSLGETEVAAEVYWLHEVLQSDNTIDIAGKSPVALGSETALTLQESVATGTGLQVEADGLDDGPTFTIARGSGTIALGTSGDAQAGYRTYNAILEGELPNGVKAVYSSNEHSVLFTGLRLIVDSTERVGVQADPEVTIQAQWLHAHDLDGNPIDRFELGHETIQVRRGDENVNVGVLSDTNGNEATDIVPLDPGKNEVVYTGEEMGLTVFGAEIDLYRLDAAFVEVPSDETIPVGEDYQGSFSVEINENPLDESFQLEPFTLETHLAGESSLQEIFDPSTVHMANSFSALLGGQTVSDIAISHDSDNGEWNFVIGEAGPGTYNVQLELVLGDISGEPVVVVMGESFSVTQELYRVTIEDIPESADAEDPSQIWIDKDTELVTVEFQVETGDWDGQDFTDVTAAPEDTVVELWVRENGGDWTQDQALVLSDASGTGSFDLDNFPDDEAGVKQVRLVVVDKEEDTDNPDFAAHDGLNPNTMHSESDLFFTALVVAFDDPVDKIVLQGDSIALDYTVTYEHDGSPVDAATVQLEGTALGPKSGTTDASGEGTVSFLVAGTLKVDDLIAEIASGSDHHGLSLPDPVGYDGSLRWVEVIMDEVLFSTSTDGSSFSEPAPADDNHLVAPPGTYVEVVAKIIYDDGTQDPLSPDSGLVKFGSRNVGLNSEGEGERIYFSSSQRLLEVDVSIVTTSLGDITLSGGTQDTFTIEWSS